MFKIPAIQSAKVIRITLAVLLLIDVQAVLAQEPSALNRSTLLSNKVELPSKNIDAKVIRVTFPPAFKTPWHTHEGPGPRYVVKGKLKIVEEGKVNIYSVGDVFWESGHLMSVENIGEDSAELIIFELVPAK
ncbi:MAG: cupin domain-containing protein [Methylococcaceae bacterium]|jgi:quercetin dioxygenase-like cupin family protein|nr:cupin domain-containing protein [Methylococcaceae bacterium]MDD1631128.1 cupin domain-containing protein [Methylococcaceae bacterium]MDD1637843.1 cupin domain-containing protein [Methylococcaceae bacterium]MDD1644404.1 cupin domain-containing protein [Methylococcaceae bacterium]OYV20994.1 MAG: cupin [Methylococcaceae bacterium NSM2-1]